MTYHSWKVKAQTATLKYRIRPSEDEYLLNLIDTPGHVDFSWYATAPAVPLSPVNLGYPREGEEVKKT